MSFMKIGSYIYSSVYSWCLDFLFLLTRVLTKTRNPKNTTMKVFSYKNQPSEQTVSCTMSSENPQEAVEDFSILTPYKWRLFFSVQYWWAI